MWLMSCRSLFTLVISVSLGCVGGGGGGGGRRRRRRRCRRKYGMNLGTLN